MAKLFCAVVGAAGSAFPVDIDESQSVGDLKKAIKQEEEYDFAASKLQLYVAKKGDAWLNSDGAAAVTLDEHGNPQGFDKMDPSLWIKNDRYFGEKFQPNEGQIHVLVVVPPVDVVFPPSAHVAVPTGPEVDLRSCEHLLEFLEGEMTNKMDIVSRPHILAQDSLEFRLVGREQAIDTASNCFKSIITHASRTALDRTKVAMPVCSGISGLWKTRMLEEGATILQNIKLDPKHVVCVIVPYFNGYIPQPVERSMPIVASFSWRLLYRFFLDLNCDLSFPKWFESRLPRNGAQLTLACAIDVIERKLRQKLQEPAPLYLFLGIDEYQKIEKIGAQRKDPDTSLLRELVETIGDLLCLKSSSLVLLPMFAGTNWGVIESSSVANSSYYVTERLPMYLLSMDQVFSIAESNASYAGLLSHVQICRDLFVLGGVPRWVVEYLTAVKNTCVEGEPVTLDNIKKCFVEIWRTYVTYYLRSLETPQLIRLAAFAVSGQTVDPHDTFHGELKWSRLRDSSQCLLIPREFSTSDEHDVRVPYALLENIGSRGATLSTDAERNFASALNDIRQMVDKKLYDLEPWQSWEIFGACFDAVRINALLALGYSTVTLRELLPGTMMSDNTSSISVKLVPSRVIRCAGAFGASTQRLIKGNRQEPIDWTSGGFIVVNGDDGGAGVDIYFALKDATTGNVVVIVDQRKRQFGKCQPSHAKTYLAKLSVCPDFLVASGARLVRGVMNCVSSSNLATYVVPDNCFLLSRAETELFYGTLAYHPACSPVISINTTRKTALKTVLEGDAEEVDEVVREIVRKREHDGFRTSDALRSFIEAKRLKVRVDDEFAEFSF